jgi:eukaryotic-like serine/threonine-protein kinase
VTDALFGGLDRDRARTTTLTRGWTLGARKIEDVGRAMLPKAPPTTRAPGQVVTSRYRLERPIGDGGMGEVWLAHHLSLDAEVALKFARSDLDDGTRKRLAREARLLARLDHPSIVRVIDSGTAEDGSPFMAMELLRGQSLGGVLAERTKLSVAAAVRILLPVASALSAAHEAGIVHRDLKPDNVLLVRAKSGAITPKVLDFGVAKSGGLELDGATTVEGTLIGSPDYMSPEQAAGGIEIDARSDVWSFCLVFYEVVTGRHPFARNSLEETLRAILHEPVAPIVGDGGLWSIVARGLGKHPDFRWQSMREVGEQLAAWAVAHGIHEDSIGASIHAQWLAGASRPLSEAPERAAIAPPVPSRRFSAPPRSTRGDSASPSTKEPCPPCPPCPPPPRLRRAAMMIVPVVVAGLLVAGAAQVLGASPERTPPTQQRPR